MRSQWRCQWRRWCQDMRMCLERCGRYLRPCPGLKRDLHHPAPSCTILLHDLRDLISFDASSRSLPGQALGGMLELDSKLQWPRCLELPWISYICLLHPTWMCISVCQWFISHSASIQILDVFWLGSRAQRSPFYTQKSRANPTKTIFFLQGNPLSKIAKYMLYYSFSLGIFHV